jgi:murein DD-endopeptidase MepM/ murein hydrolase activator NlpD
MGDHRAGIPGPKATADPAPATPSHVPGHAAAGGKRAARHAIEPRTSQPYSGRRVAGAVVSTPLPTPLPTPQRSPQPDSAREPIPTVPAPAPAPAPADLVYAGRRVAGRRLLPPAPAPAEPEADDVDDVSAHLLTSTASPTLTPYAGRRIARTLPLITEPEPAFETPELGEPAPVLEALVLDEPVPVLETPLAVVDTSVITAPVIESPIVAPDPIPEVPVAEVPVAEVLIVEVPAVEELVAEAPALAEELLPVRVADKPSRSTGRRVASRRTRVPSLPLLAGVAVLAISAGGALQAMHPGLAGAADGHLSPASALSGSSAVGSGNVLGSRDASVSRDSDRTALSAGSGSSLQAAADAQAKQRDASLSAQLGQAQKRAAQIRLHQWVLPIPPGVYHLTARFGDYSSLWANFHTGLDFAAPTGTPIMAVASGTITEVGYSGAYGNRTIERLPDGTELWYCHQNEFGTAVGDKVRAGQVIGYVGSTGNVTGPHLHLEVHPGGGDPVDPYAALVARGLYPGPPA